MKTERLALGAIGIAALASPGLASWHGAAEAKPAPGVLRARAIELVDSRGTVRAQLNVQGAQVVLRLRDARGVLRVKLGADEAGSGLVLNNELTEPGIHLLATRNGTSLALQRGETRRVLTPTP
jgi:hypothetical protein